MGAKIREFGPQGLSNTAWAYAKLEWQDGPLFAAISSASIRLRYQFVPQGLTTSAWAVATFGVFDFPLLDALAAASIRKISHFNPQDCFMLAWSWSVMSMVDDKICLHRRALRLSGVRFPLVAASATGVDWIE